MTIKFVYEKQFVYKYLQNIKYPIIKVYLKYID